MEHENEELKEQIKHKTMETDHVESLSDELGIWDRRSHNVSPECDGNVGNSANLKNHMNMMNNYLNSKPLLCPAAQQTLQRINCFCLSPFFFAIFCL